MKSTLKPEAPPQCLVCWRPLPESERGRPRVFCSASCKDEAEHAARRARRRIEKLESERTTYTRMCEAPDQSPFDHADLGPITPRQALVNVEHAIVREVDRLRALSVDTGAGGDA